MIAKVIVDVTNSQVDKVFDYEIDDESIKIGQRVFVPFGNRIIQGFVIGKSQESNIDKSRLKKVVSAIDDFACITDEMIELMGFMVHKYHLRYIDCLRLFIPSEMRTDRVKPLSKMYCVLSKDIKKDDVKNATRKNAKNILALIDFLQYDVYYEKANLCEQFTSSAVNKLIEAGVLALSKKDIKRNPDFEAKEVVRHKHTELQKNAIQKILEQPKPYLLFGVTGSGKTEVYMSVIERVISQQKTAIMLVPEISLTPQVLSNFKARFGEDVAILHSGLSAGERFDEWRRLAFGEAKIVIGARSAIFAPLKDVGVIIIDEEHESSYISENNPRYNSFDVANFRRQYNNCPLVLASATPTIEHYEMAENGELGLIELPVRVNGKEMPKIQIVDMLMELRNGNSSMFSNQLLSDLQSCIDRKKQAMLFINRRGYSSFMRCMSCGYVAKCSDCDVSLVYHKDDEKLKCHYCGKRFKALTKCPECGSESIRQGAVGTERVCAELAKLFPGVKIVRMDNDTTRTKNAHSKLLKEFGEAKPGILVGTQMIAKGHDFKDVVLVGIIDADQSLYHSDYKSTEKTFQLITQMSGRAGRDKDEGKVVLQTYAPRHYAYRFIASYNYKGFFDKEINIRRVTKFPPFTNIVRLLFTSESDEYARECTKACYSKIKELSQSGNDFVYLDVMKSPIGRIKNKFRYQILMRLLPENSEQIIQNIYEICDSNKNQNVSVFVELDPQSLS
ncbi:MAG: primosomal protein N' [Clostridia bacterium]|nr:primosomal protein N' [Clostridia bacterium]